MDKYYLMYKDTPVISFGNHFEELTILDTAYLPYGLRNRRIETAISSWLADRATPITRDNAEFLYMALGLFLDKEGRRICYMGRGFAIYRII